MSLTAIDLDRIGAEAQEIEFSKGLLTVLAAILFTIGFFFGVMSRGLAWTVAAVRIGYRAGRKAGMSGAAVARAG